MEREDGRLGSGIRLWVIREVGWHRQVRRLSGSVRRESRSDNTMEWRSGSDSYCVRSKHGQRLGVYCKDQSQLQRFCPLLDI